MMSKEMGYGQELGPVEYIVVAFDGNEFQGEILPALYELFDSGQIRIIDLAVIGKDGDDNVTVIEATELYSDVADVLEKLTGEFTGLLSEEDLLMAADELPANTTAAAMLFEHVWATRFSSAVRDANGWLVTSARIPAEVIETARQTLIEAAANM
jgi:hypothetical protein